MMLEDYIYIYILQVCWNYGLMKIDIDVMMLFKFEFKYVKLNFKAIASMEFSFDIKFYLSCSKVDMAIVVSPSCWITPIIDYSKHYVCVLHDHGLPWAVQ